MTLGEFAQIGFWEKLMVKKEAYLLSISGAG